jgi:glycine/D-amino acid oxidase-like deaminating enzyme
MATGPAIWGDQLTANEPAQLMRGGRTIPLPRPDVLVVGGGIVGVATAAALHRAGAGSVLLIEAGRLGSGASGGAAGLLLPEAHAGSDPEPFVTLARSRTGILMAPATAQIITGWIASGQPPPGAAAWSSARFG